MSIALLARRLCLGHRFPICGSMLPRLRALPAGFIAPCLPINAPQPPSGEQWLHEIKHDGFRIIARKDGKRVKLYSRPGNDLTHRFPLIVESIAKLRSRSCIIDGEAVACGEDGIASGQNSRLPQRNIGIRFTPVSRHYASEAVQPFVAPSMSSLDSDFVLKAIQVFGSTIAKAWRCLQLLLRLGCFQFGPHL